MLTGLDRFFFKLLAWQVNFPPVFSLIVAYFYLIYSIKIKLGGAMVYTLPERVLFNYIVSDECPRTTIPFIIFVEIGHIAF